VRASREARAAEARKKARESGGSADAADDVFVDERERGWLGEADKPL